MNAVAASGSPALSLFGSMLALLLLTLALIDAERMILPDWLNAMLAAIGIAQSLLLRSPVLLDAGIGSLFGAGLFALVGFGFRQWRGHDGLGLGDVKFAGAAGFWIGWQGIPIMILSASLLALLFVTLQALLQGDFDLRARLPFGPFLCAGTFFAWLITVAS